MSFLYPIFLAAGIVLAVPVLIHLFNLRRYRTVLFPHTRFLKNIQLHSRRLREVRYRWLLLPRLFFLRFLVLAFAQPFFNREREQGGDNRLRVIYLDNSYSMSAGDDTRRSLDIARDAVMQQVKREGLSGRFLLLTNDRPLHHRPVSGDELLHSLNDIEITGSTRSFDQVLAMVQEYMRSESVAGADLYYYSDFQQSRFSALADTALLRDIRVYGVAVQPVNLRNIFIDTAWLETPSLQAGGSNRLIVRTKAEGVQDGSSVLQLRLNGQVKTAASLDFSGTDTRLDTLSFQVNGTGWQRMVLAVDDGGMRFDDTFRISAKSAPGLSVLILDEGQANPYLQAAFRAYDGFRVSRSEMDRLPERTDDFNLIVLDGITGLNARSGEWISRALEAGKTICIFPGKAAGPAAFNEGLRMIGDIRVAGIDTVQQTASTLQQGSELVRGIFERIPEQVQLPVANWHYILDAGPDANQQSVLSFRNGDPFLAAYSPSRGRLYICATAADLPAGNFPVSYFFAPFLYQMAMQSEGSAVYAITSGMQQAAYLPLAGAGERNMVHLYGEGLDAVPPQRISGAGLNVYVDQAVQQPGFYSLAAKGGDTTLVALNADRRESDLQVWSVAALKEQWPDKRITWSEPGKGAASGGDMMNRSFPLWKVCIILALIMLSAETILLAGSLRKQTVAAQ